MKITIHDGPKLRNHVLAAGFASIEDYIQHLVEEDLAISSAVEVPTQDVSCDEWIKEFRALLGTATCGGREVDTSRESIYAERIAELNPHDHAD